MTSKRSFDRTTSSLRPVSIEPNFYPYAEGSVVVSFGNTQVLCVATIEDSAPPHLRGKGQGWVTAEYAMLPRSSPQRIKRDREKVNGRTQEIQRLIGRAMRSIVNMQGWGERTITLDCDVLRADGGTRTASITGAYVAMVMAFRKLKASGKIPASTPFPIKDYVSAVSVGLVGGVAMLDLDYVEDSTAETDMNFVMTSQGNMIEVQGTAEKDPFTPAQFEELMKLGRLGCEGLCTIQREILGPLDWTGGKPA